MNFTRFGALSFDCYGTLIDWEKGILERLRPWARSHAVDVTGAELLGAFGDIEPVCEQDAPGAVYRDVLHEVHRRIAIHFGVEPCPSAADDFAGSVGTWPVFDDTVAALRRLHEQFKLIIVSNVDNASFAQTNRLLQVRFDAIVTAQDVGAYKPDHKIFRRMFAAAESMGIVPRSVLHVAQSLYHDHVPAKELGMTTVWVRRTGAAGAARLPVTAVAPDLTVETLAELANLIGELA